MVKSNAFDNFSQEYDRWFENHEVEYERELEAIKKLIPRAGKGIEIGAGTGRFSEPFGVTLGVEPSKAMRSNIGTLQGAVLTYAPYVSVLLSDDPFGDDWS